MKFNCKMKQSNRHIEFRTQPTFPLSSIKRNTSLANTFISPAPTEPSRTVKVGSAENDANISNISLKEEKSSLTKLNRHLSELTTN
jgi:hypothetical protein